MAKIHVLGSSSDGNSYIIETSGSYLLLEAGVKPSLIWKEVGYDRSKILGCLVSHVHGDHAKYAESIAYKDIDIYCNQNVADNKKIPFPRAKVVPPNKWFSVGDFRILPFECRHDVPNYGYIIKHPEFDPILFGTDTFAYPSLFQGVGNYLIEANYSDELLRASDADQAQKNRLLTSHMSLDYCIKYLHDCDAEEANTITLIHLSSRHSDEQAFQRKVQSEFLVPTYIADKGVVIDISKQLA